MGVSVCLSAVSCEVHEWGREGPVSADLRLRPASMHPQDFGGRNRQQGTWPGSLGKPGFLGSYSVREGSWGTGRWDRTQGSI